MTPRRTAVVRSGAAIRAISAVSMLALAVATLLPLHSAAWSHEDQLAASAGPVLTAQTGAHDTHRHPRTAGDVCEACVATTQVRSAPVNAAGPHLETPFGEVVAVAVSTPLFLPAAPARAQNHSRAPPASA